MQRVADAVVAHVRGARADGQALLRTLVAGPADVDAASVRIGVDAEPIAAAPGRLEALRELLPSPGGDPLRRWTQVEAVLKADGRGLRLEPSAVLMDASAHPVTAVVPGASRRYDVHEVELRWRSDERRRQPPASRALHVGARR